jgi:hypothetical protein
MSEEHSKPPLSLISQDAIADLLPTQIPTGGGNLCFVDALLTSSEVRSFKRELKPLLEDLHEVN